MTLVHMQSRFVKHEPCPQCRERGEDRSGNNLGRYDDGHAWCFSCGYVEPATHLPTPKKENFEDTISPPKDMVKEIPEPNLSWLRQYLTDEEIETYFYYSPSLKRHIYMKIFDDGSKYWEARSVVATDKVGEYKYIAPKTKSVGRKPSTILGMSAAKGKLVVVEDIISAIKISRHTAALPLFGSYFSPEAMVRISKLSFISEVIIWLDYNKYAEAIKFASKMSILKPTTVICTQKDPKAINDEDLLEYLGL